MFSQTASSADFPEESVQYLQGQKVKTNPAVQGIFRNKDIIKALPVPQ